MRPPHSFAAAGGLQGPDSHLQLRPPLAFRDARNLSPDGRPSAPTAPGDKQARNTDGLASSMVCCGRSRRSQSGTIQVRLLLLAMGPTLLVDSLPALLGVRKET